LALCLSVLRAAMLFWIRMASDGSEINLQACYRQIRGFL
jgi:hypothetical protein